MLSFAAIVAAVAVLLFAIASILRSVRQEGRTAMEHICELLQDQSAEATETRERLIEKIIARDPDYSTQQHSVERENKRRLDAYVQANESFMQQPPPAAPEVPISALEPDEVPDPNVQPFDMGTG